MICRFAGSISAICAAAGIAAAPAAAAPACWSREDVAAAKVADLQTMLVTVSPRCEAAGNGTAAEVRAFAEANRMAIAAGEQRLKARFWTLEGPEQGRRHFVAYGETLARFYVAVPPVAENCAQVAAVAREAAAGAGTLAGLIAVAERNHFTPALPGGLCDMKIAAR